MTAHHAALSFDVEDWHHSELLPPETDRARVPSIVRAGTETILGLLARRRTRATFFLLGDVVRDHPDLVRRIAGEGHEIGCHGIGHRPLWKIDASALRAELATFRELVDAVAPGTPVVGYRAPNFSLDRSTAWAVAVLESAGFVYDSSVFPARVKLYGVPNAPLGIYRPARDDPAREDPRGGLVEFPVAVGRWAGVRVPVAGGFYLRALPFAVFRRTLDRILRERPVALYLHPRECSPEAERVRTGLVNGWITYVNLHTVVPKLERLLARYAFLPMREVLEREGHVGKAAGLAS
jgi:polysaccharide deacetylase family protein (PEP-CTERM system associated)